MLEGKRILVLEDNPIVKLGVEALLRDAGAEIALAFDRKLDAAVLDVNLGNGVTSLPIASRLQERDVPFLFYSGQSDTYLAPVRRAFPDKPLISKPATAERIVSEVANLCRRNSKNP